MGLTEAGMGGKIRLTMAQALVRYLARLRTDLPGDVPLFGGVFAIFGHGNVAGIGEALYQVRDQLPTYRSHNEQAMTLSAVAFAKSHMRRRMMACTTSIGPGATNMVTAAAVAHVNRLPVLLLPGDIFVSRAPDPVLQQVEDLHDGGISANDCLKPVSRYFDRIVHPQQLLTALPRAIHVLTDPALCGPVTLALPQDVQTMAYDWPEEFFSPHRITLRMLSPAPSELREAAATLKQAKRPLLVAGGGILYGDATGVLRDFAEAHGVPVAETQAGKGALPWDHALQLGSLGVTGSTAANAIARDADLVFAVGTRLQDFTTGSHSLFTQAKLLNLNVNGFDATKLGGLPLQADARSGLQALDMALPGWKADARWTAQAAQLATQWRTTVDSITGNRDVKLPYEGEVIGAVQRSSPNSAERDIVVCAAGGLPGELHKLWRTSLPGGYHLEYGYSCMGYEIAGGLGVKMARPDREVIVIVGDGSYLMMNSEIATSIMLGLKLVIVLLDNRGYGCIHRLQEACGGAPFNNLFDDGVATANGAPRIDFVAHARAMGANAEMADDIGALEAALRRARAANRTSLVCIATDPKRTTLEGGWWWEVAVPEVSSRSEVTVARKSYEQGKQQQKP
ncbi:MAG TPA: 3D-(3,5/4)-trihydroxycyclohexane-1,2-dione acylhydrolase (decyclizing) [Burkholderiales bacterium]|nr:3D-(3,5/4)-trihydroxycyclohexane-1,2-dione acylhydrolase (decyclizing) [Burkholderiales bacterium]